MICPICWGKGRVAVEPDVADLVFVIAGTIRCPACDGEGKVFAKNYFRKLFTFTLRRKIKFILKKLKL